MAALSRPPLRGLDSGCVFFGINDARVGLTPASCPALEHLLHDLEVHRHPLASDTRHALYRVQPERWLESIVREDVTRIAAMLDQRFVYAQVFANAGGGEHGILDLLTVTRSGRLAVTELKASEHMHLPLQAADYWLRVRRQLQSGEITRYGYFQEVAVRQARHSSLVASALRFHPATDDLLKYLSPELEVARVALPKAGAGDCAWS
jgi:hypothetical protein